MRMIGMFVVDASLMVIEMVVFECSGWKKVVGLFGYAPRRSLCMQQGLWGQGRCRRWERRRRRNSLMMTIAEEVAEVEVLEVHAVEWRRMIVGISIGL